MYEIIKRETSKYPDQEEDLNGVSMDKEDGAKQG
jgi:hypothetical protein